MDTNNSRLLRSLFLQAIGFCALALGNLIGLTYLNVVLSLVIGGVLILLDLIFLAIKDKNRPYALAGWIGMFATGIIMGGFLGKFNLQVEWILYGTLMMLGAVVVIHGIIRITKNNRFVLVMVLALILAVAITLYVNFSDTRMKLFAFLTTNLWCIQIGLLLSIDKYKPVDRYVTGGMLWAFAIVFIVILIVITEGDALQGLDAFDIGTGERKKKRK